MSKEALIERFSHRARTVEEVKLCTYCITEPPIDGSVLKHVMLETIGELLELSGLVLMPAGDEEKAERMTQIDTVIADFQKVSDRFGNTCVYFRRGGLSWGAVALNRKADDRKHGVLDMQAAHDRERIRHAGQVKRLIAARDSEREAREKCSAALVKKDKAMSVLFDRLRDARIDVSDLIS